MTQTTRFTIPSALQLLIACLLVFTCVAALPSITILSPANNSLQNSTAVSYILSETLDSGSVKWWQMIEGVDVQVHGGEMQGIELQAGTFTGILNNWPNLFDGAVYNISFLGFNSNGTAPFVMSTNVAYDFPPTVTIQRPLSNTAISNATISYTLSEACSAATVTWTSTTGNTTIATLTGSDLTVGTHTNVNFLITLSGTYTVTFRCIDLAGNTGTATVTNISIDTTPPVALPSVSIRSNFTNTSKAGPGSLVTVSFTAPEPINATVTISGQPAVVSNTGLSYTASRVMTITDTPGVISFTITYADLAGNAGPATSTTTDTSSVTLDLTPPVITSISIQNGSYTISSIIPITITADGVGYTIANITVNTVPIIVLTDNNNGTYTAIYTVRAGDTDRAAGTIPVSVQLRDEIGNVNTANITVNPNNASIDTIVQLIAVDAFSPNSTVNVGESVTVTLSFNETIATATGTVNNVSINWTITNTTVNGVYTVSANDSARPLNTMPLAVTVTDLVGNARIITAFTSGTPLINTSVDVTAPIALSVIATPSNGTVNIGGNVTITLTFNENIATATGSVNTISIPWVISNATITGVYTVNATDYARLANAMPLAVTVSDITGNTGIISAFTSGTPAINTTIAPPVVINSTDINSTIPGTIVPGSGNSTNTTNATLNAQLIINYPSGATVTIPQGTVITRSDGQSFDLTAITAIDAITSGITNFPVNRNVIAVFEFGIPGIELRFSTPITLSIYNGAGYNGQIFEIYRASLLSGSWIQTGISPTTCTITANYCTFTTTLASFFADSQITTTPPPRSGGGGGHRGGGGFIPIANVTNTTNTTNTTRVNTTGINITKLINTTHPIIVNETLQNKTNGTAPKITGAFIGSLPFTGVALAIAALVIIGFAVIIRTVRRYR